MKKVIVLLAVLAMAVPAFAFHGRPDWKDNSYDCDSCHLPHTKDAEGAVTGVPLWSGYDITDEEGGGPAEWTMYSSPTMDAVVPGAPTGSTLLCLGCHDTRSHAINPTPGDLSATHPVDFVYDAALATLDGELVNPDDPGSSGMSRGTGLHSISEDLLEPMLDGEGNVAGGIMRCTSCHEIHKNGLQTDHKEGDATDDTGATVHYSYDFDIPRLQPITGGYTIGYAYSSHGGDPLNEDDWSLNYGLLCKTCHEK